jgi:hypothetical protein
MKEQNTDLEYREIIDEQLDKLCIDNFISEEQYIHAIEHIEDICIFVKNGMPLLEAVNNSFDFASI